MNLLSSLKKSIQLQLPEGSIVSTNDILVSLLWKHIIKVRGINYSEKSTCFFQVNARKRLVPPLPDVYFGNVVVSACPQLTVEELVNLPLAATCQAVRQGLNNVNNTYLQSFLNLVESLEDKKLIDLRRHNHKEKVFLVTNWCQFPIYSVEFGEMSPHKVCLSPEGGGRDGIAIVFPDKDSGILVYLSLEEKHMEELLQNEEFSMWFDVL